MRPSQKDDKAQMLLATGVVLMMSLLSMAIFAIKLAGMSVPHDVASDGVIQTTQDVESVLPGLVESRQERPCAQAGSQHRLPNRLLAGQGGGGGAAAGAAPG